MVYRSTTLIYIIFDFDSRFRRTNVVKFRRQALIAGLMAVTVRSSVADRGRAWLPRGGHTSPTSCRARPRRAAACLNTPRTRPLPPALSFGFLFSPSSPAASIAQRRSRTGAIGSAKLAHVVQSPPYQRHRSPLLCIHLPAEPFELW